MSAGSVSREVKERVNPGGLVNIQYAMVFVSDMQRATGFYRDVIGLPLKFESSEWTEFATEGATLALHATDAPAGKRKAGEDAAGSVRIGFNVIDLDAFHQRMVENDVPCVQEPSMLFGARLAQYSGPDGLVFSVGESRKR